MLVLSRKKGERICIGDGIVLTVLETRNNQVRLGIEAPDEVAVHREEIWSRIREFGPVKQSTGLNSLG